jgi:hypothetical protein
MNITRLNITLAGYNVGLTGAIPDRKDWSEAAMDRAILEFVALLSGIIFKYGGRIIHGCHPTFTPIILRQARLHASLDANKPVTLVMSELWAQDLSQSEIDAMTDVADFIVTPKVGNGGPEDVVTRNNSLSLMRRTLIKEQNVMVAVGGKMHSEDGIVQGVAEEMAMAAEAAMPRFLVGGMGGAAQDLAGKLAPSSLNNELSREEDILLFGSNDISASVNLIFKQLSSHTLKIRKKVTRKPRI